MDLPPRRIESSTDNVQACQFLRAVSLEEVTRRGRAWMSAGRLERLNPMSFEGVSKQVSIHLAIPAEAWWPKCYIMNGM